MARTWSTVTQYRVGGGYRIAEVAWPGATSARKGFDRAKRNHPEHVIEVRLFSGLSCVDRWPFTDGKGSGI